MGLKANYTNQLFNEYQLLELKNHKLDKENKLLKLEKQLLQTQVKDKDKEIENLNKEIARLKGVLNNDGTNCSLPTSQTPINKNKIIPNSRSKSNNTIGGQKGHKKHKLEKFKDEEINETEYVELKKCLECNHELTDTNETIDKDVFDYEIFIVKKRVKFKKYKCSCCGKEVHAKIPNELKEEIQYGPNVKSLILTLLNEGYISISRVKKIIKGLSLGEMDLSEGYIAKVQKNSSKLLNEFEEELKEKIIKKDLVYWDDTTIFVDTKRSCLRFYGDEKLAMYVAHKQKNKEGLDEDDILRNLDNKTKVMHDHNKVNYNKEYSFINLECNAHLQRDLQKVIDNLDSNWAKTLKKLISDSIKQREELINKKQTYNENFTSNFFKEYNTIMLSALKENKENEHVYYKDTEKTLILRILEYKDNYFAWVCDFELPTTNNLSERSLRSSKTKLKVSGQFKNIDRAKDFAIIKSYIETCYRNSINPFEALFRLSIGNPYTLDEILGEEK